MSAQLARDAGDAGLISGKPRKKTMRLIFVVLLMISSYAFAGCDSIRDLDQRTYCRAKEGRDSCNSISSRDLRYTCIAETSGGTCSSIIDLDQRYYCNAKTNHGSCDSIHDSDLRYTCMAETKGYGCSSIMDRNQRYMCEAKTNNGGCSSITDIDLRAQCNALKH
ncbi:hypothetical protein [Pseudomonas sp.]|uniref:hypothetical protein n=1 Tax=Pseudomonas sp. TaxID=306 RepID=UPI003917EED9